MVRWSCSGNVRAGSWSSGSPVSSYHRAPPSSPTDTTPLLPHHSLTLISIATTILTLPFTVFFNRAVVHPTGPLPTSPLQAAPVVLTKHERSSPFAMYKAPGLFIAVALKAVWSTAIVNGLKAMVAVQLLEAGEDNGGLGWIIGFGAFQALSTLIMYVQPGETASPIFSADVP